MTPPGYYGDEGPLLPLGPIPGYLHNRAYRAALNAVGEQFGGWRCEAAGCEAHGGEMGTIEWGDTPRVVCQEHWDVWWGDDREYIARQRRRREQALRWGWGLDFKTESYLVQVAANGGKKP